MIEPTRVRHHYCPSDPDGEPVELHLLSTIDLEDRRIRAYTCPGCNTLIHVEFPPSYEATRKARRRKRRA